MKQSLLLLLLIINIFQSHSVEKRNGIDPFASLTIADKSKEPVNRNNSIYDLLDIGDHETIDIRKTIDRAASPASYPDKATLLHDYIRICRHLLLNNNDSLTIFLNESIKLAHEQKDYSASAIVYSFMGYSYIKNGEIDKAVSVAEDMMHYSVGTRDINLTLAYDLLMGMIYSEYGVHDKALYFFGHFHNNTPDKYEYTDLRLLNIAMIIEQRLCNREVAHALEFCRILQKEVADIDPNGIYAHTKAIMNKINDAYFLIAFSMEPDMASASEYYERVESFKDSGDNEYVRLISLVARSFYLSFNGKATEALYLITEASELCPDNIRIKSKMALLIKNNGLNQQAADMMLKSYQTQRKKFKRMTLDDINMQIANDELIQSKESFNKSRLESIRTKSEITRALILIIAAFFVMLIILYLRIGIIRKRLKALNLELLNDKNNLMMIKSELESARNKADESNRLKSAVIANMSHEIRTPLSAIVGFSDLISQITESGSTQNHFAGIVKSNSDILLKLIHNILDISRIDSGMHKVEISDVDAVRVAENTFNNFFSNNLLNDKNGLTTIIDTPGEEIFIKSSQASIEQILNQLLDNAVKFTQSGEIKMSVSFTSESVSFSVSDTGCGIPTDKYNIVFNRFEKLNDFSDGTGLGLALSKSLAEKLGGSIKLESTVGTGSTFTVVLPRNECYKN